MKKLYLLSIPAAAIITLTSCGNSNNPSGFSGTSPLDPPGTNLYQDQDGALSNIYKPGALLVTASPSNPFFNRVPRDNDQPIKTLPKNTDVRIISVKGSYANIEVLNTGEIGYVPTVLLTEAVAVAPPVGDAPEIDIPGADPQPPADFVPPLPPSDE